MPERPYILRTEVVVTLGEAFPSNNETLIFKAFLVHGETRDRLEIFEDIHGVHQKLLVLGLVEEPETFAEKEDRYRFWADVLANVVIEWDHSKLTPGNSVRLKYPLSSDDPTPLCEWRVPARMQFSIERQYT